MIIGNTTAELRRLHATGKLKSPGRPGMRACSAVTPGNWYRTVSWDPTARLCSGAWLVASEDGPWGKASIGEVGWLEVLDYTDGATEGALLSLFRELDGPMAQVGLVSMGTERGTVWRLLSDSRCFVADGPTPALVAARGLCMDGALNGRGEWTQSDADEYRAATRIG